MTEMEGGKKKTFVPPQERNIAMVFQEYALYPNMTVRKNMSFALETRKRPRRRFSAGGRNGQDAVHRPSSGSPPGGVVRRSRQRVALGRALVRDPQVFLLDEPLGNLDAKLRDQVRYELKKIQTQLGITTIYVTHDQTEAMTMADHIVLMKDGHIMQEGTPNDLYNHPNCEFVAGFLGTPQINLFSCRVENGKSGMTLKTENFSLPVPEDCVDCSSPTRGRKSTWASGLPIWRWPPTERFPARWNPLSPWGMPTWCMCASAKRWLSSSTPRRKPLPGER